MDGLPRAGESSDRGRSSVRTLPRGPAGIRVRGGIPGRYNGHHVRTGEEGAMSERRQQRVAEEIQRRASTFIREELKDPRLGFLTITGVDVNSDLTNALIYVSVLGSEEEQNQTMEALR